MSPDSSANVDRPRPRVGVIGTGRAGRWFVTKLVRADYETVAFDVEDAALDEAVDRGATPAASAADLARRSDVVVLCLPTREAVETSMEGADGVLDALEVGQVVVDAGTTPPNLDVHYQRVCHDRDAGYVDCGMTRHGPGAADRDGEPAYNMFVGGEEADYRLVRPVIETLSHHHEFFEGIGAGHTVKAAVVLRATCRVAMAAEVCEFLANAGIDPERVVELLEWEIPEPFLDPPYLTNRGFERAVSGSENRETDGSDQDVGEEGRNAGRGVGIDDDGARPRLHTSDWAKDPAYALAVARAANSHVPMLTAAYQQTLLAENLGRAVVDRDLAFNDPEWHMFNVRSLYRALARPGAEWRRLDRWEASGE